MGARSGYPEARRLIAAALISSAALGVVPAAASAADATVKGTLEGKGIPDAGEGVAGVRAVNAETGAIGGADYTGGRRDSWQLRLAPGPYALAAATTPFEGGKLVDRFVAFVGARSGKTESLTLRLKPKRRRHAASATRRPGRVSEGFGDVAVDYPAIWVKDWEIQSSDPEHGVLSHGMADMLTTDLVEGFERDDCRAVLVERARIGEVLTEQRLQHLPGFDQSTAVRRGRLIIDNASVSGTLVGSGGNVTLTATYTDRRRNPAKTKTVSVQGPAESIFSLEQQLAQKLIELICSDGLPDIYTGSFSGRSADSEMTRTWSGTVTYERVKPPEPRAAQCAGAGIACYDVVSGSVTWQISTSPGAFCTYQTPSQTDSIPPGSGGITVQADGSDEPGYGGGLTASASAPGTIQCGSSDPGSVPLALQDCCFATPAQSDPGSPWTVFAQNGGWILQGTRTSTGGGSAVTSSWNLTGE